MELHPREEMVDEAEREIHLAFREIRSKYQLTTGEFMMIIGQQLSHYAKYQIRYERHGDGDTPGGLK